MRSRAPLRKYRRVVAERRGGPEVLRVLEEPLREPERGEVRVRTLVSGVSFADLFMREGFHPEALMRRFPLTPGWDIVGHIDALGPGAEGFAPGDVVAALPIVGGYSEFLFLRPEELVAVPSGLDPVEVVCLILNYGTAYQMLHRSARVRKGEAVLVHSAAGGVGTALLQLGRLAQLKMYGTSSPAKHGAISELGGIPIDYRSVDFVSECRSREPQGLDAVFDGIGGMHLLRSLRVLRRGGRLIGYGFGSTSEAGRPSLRRFASTTLGWLAAFAHNLVPRHKRLKLYSIQMRKRRRPDDFRADLTELLDLLGQGRIRPLVAARLPLAEAARAHELLASGRTTGKIVLTMD